MNLEKMNEAARNNFFNHIELSKNSEFFRKYDKEFFKDLNIDSPFIDKEEILAKLVKIKNIDTLDNLNIDDNKIKFTEKSNQKEIKIKDDLFNNLNIDANTIKFIEKISQKEIKDDFFNNLDIDSKNKIISTNKPSKLKV